MKTNLAKLPAMQRLGASIAEREKNRVQQLPLWPEPKWGAPNAFIRSALFAAIQGKDRQFIREEVLASVSGITVKFTGEQLNQDDMDVWEQIVQFHREQPLGLACTFTAYSLLRELGLSTGLSQHKKLHSTIIRLQACSAEVTHNDRTFFGPLIKSGVKDEITRHYCVELNKDLLRLFGDNQWTALDREQRKLLKRQPLAQALHAFYSSHRTPFPMKVETLKDITGSRNCHAGSFKRQMKTALQELVNIGFLTKFEIVGDMVTVQRTAIALK
jgi:TrfA protein